MQIAMDSSCYCVFVLHVLMLCVTGYGLWYDVMYLSENGESVLQYRGYPGKFKYLTFWCQILQTVFFGYSIVNDLIGTNLKPGQSPSRRSSLQKVRDLIASSVIFPVGCFVVITFWGIYAIDRELVFPKALDAIVPQWLNHVMHTTVIVFLLVEKFFVYHHYPRRRTGLKFCLGFALLYQLWILWIAFHADIWVYPILAVLTWPGRIGFLAACWVGFILFYLLGEKITEIMWRSGKVIPAAKKIK